MSDLLAVLLAVLLAGNAFFVGAEFALISARRDRLEHARRRGGHAGRAARCCGPAGDLSRMLAAPSSASRSARCCSAGSASPRSRT